MINFTKKTKLFFLLSSVFLVSSVIADAKESTFSLVTDNKKFNITEKIIPTYNLYCESMCTATYIQKASLCSNLNREKNIEKCYEDAKDWEDECLMDCK